MGEKAKKPKKMNKLTVTRIICLFMAVLMVLSLIPIAFMV